MTENAKPKRYKLKEVIEYKEDEQDRDDRER